MTNAQDVVIIARNQSVFAGDGVMPGNPEAIIIAILSVLALWTIAAWRKVKRQSLALVSTLADSASISLYALALTYSRLVPGAFEERIETPATPATGIGSLGVLLAMVGFCFGAYGICKRGSGSISSTLIAVVIGTIWIPVCLV